MSELWIEMTGLPRAAGSKMVDIPRDIPRHGIEAGCRGERSANTFDVIFDEMVEMVVNGRLPC